jgi:cell division protein FtsW
MKVASSDRVFLTIVGILVVGGLFVFASASLGLLARVDAAPERLALTQLALGLIPGVLALFFIRKLPASYLVRVSPYLYALTLIATLLVFTPLGETFNGATRWINIGFTTIQPSEFLKIAVVLMLAWILSRAKGQFIEMKKGLFPFLVVLGIPCTILIAQPNTSTVIVLGITGVIMYFVAGAPWRDLFILTTVALVLFGALVMMRPYVLERVQTFIDPSRDPLSSGYQVQQSLIAIGSGEVIGRGFGQSVQKFNYLPEPVGDSIFAVYGEEFGFAGTLIMVLLFTAFAARGLAIAGEASSLFGSLVATGFTSMITMSAFLNMGAMLSIFPLTGLPLPFISHGGTALFSALVAVGIILNVSAHRKTHK